MQKIREKFDLSREEAAQYNQINPVRQSEISIKRQESASSFLFMGFSPITIHMSVSNPPKM